MNDFHKSYLCEVFRNIPQCATRTRCKCESLDYNKGDGQRLHIFVQKSALEQSPYLSKL